MARASPSGAPAPVGGRAELVAGASGVELGSEPLERRGCRGELEPAFSS